MSNVLELENNPVVVSEIQQVVNRWPLAELEDIESSACAECWIALENLSAKALSLFKENGYAYIVTNYHD